MDKLYDEMIRTDKHLIQINVTPEFADELVAKFYADGAYIAHDLTEDGISASYLGIPVFVDNTLQVLSYKLIYEEDKCCSCPNIVNQTSVVVKPWCSYKHHETKCRNCGKVFFEERERM